MVVLTQTPRVLELRRSVMEWHLVNHPLDCPVCDQAGECWLQIYYMQHGLYEPRMIDDKVHKPKAVPIGPHVMLDAERCILCSRCVRFCDTVTKTGELGIFNRGDHSELGLFPGTTLDNAYSGNVVDICPVGALTDRDFRFQARVWYLDRAKSVCPGCARGCNIEVHTNTKRAHHAQGRRVVRLKPRFNADVNQWWMCDEGRYGFARRRRAHPPRAAQLREGGAPRALPWDEALAAAAQGLRAAGPEGTGVLFSPRMSNEDLWLARRLFVDTLGVAHADFRVPPRAPGSHDDLLRVADKTSQQPRRRGARLRTRRGGRRAARPRGRPSGSAPAPLDLRPRPLRVGLARGGGRGGAGAGRGHRLPGAEREPDERAGARGPAERGLRGARRHLDERDGPRPAVLARRPAARRGARGLGDRGGASPGRSARTGSPSGRRTSSATWRPRARPSPA